MSQASGTHNLDWLVESRNSIQALMLKILRILEARECEEDHLDVSMLAVSHLMVAAAYSLWRAVFLGHVTLDERDIADSAKNFLLTLIEDNAIGYPQERKMREWTFGYYTNNARFRIGEIAHRSSAFKKIMVESGAADMMYVVAARKKPEELWNETFAGLELAVQNTNAVFASIATSRPETSA